MIPLDVTIDRYNKQNKDLKAKFKNFKDEDEEVTSKEQGDEKITYDDILKKIGNF